MGDICKIPATSASGFGTKAWDPALMGNRSSPGLISFTSFSQARTPSSETFSARAQWADHSACILRLPRSPCRGRTSILQVEGLVR